MSYVTGSEQAIENTQRSITRLFQRVDAGHVEVDLTRTSLKGTGGRIEIGKAGGGNWRYNGGFVWRSPELELNDVGFLRQTYEMIQFKNLRYLWRIPTKIYREIQVRAEQFTTYDFDGNQNRTQYEFQGNINWINNWFTEIGYGHKPRIFENSYLRGGPRWRFADENFKFLFFGSDRSKKMSFTLGYVSSKSEENVVNFKRYVFRLNYQPFDSFSMSLNNEIERTVDKTQYISTIDFGNNQRYILGNINNQSWSTTLRMNYSINPNMSIQFYGQPFIARGRYSDFNYVNNPTAESINDRVLLYNDHQISAGFDLEGNEIYMIDENIDTIEDYRFNKPDFSFVQFRSNLVARWEYIPGSEIFLVWSQGVVGFDDPTKSLGSSLRNQIVNQQKDNTFLIKVTYRFVK
jgi:hypothetical protein